MIVDDYHFANLRTLLFQGAEQDGQSVFFVSCRDDDRYRGGFIRSFREALQGGVGNFPKQKERQEPDKGQEDKDGNGHAFS